MPDKITLTLDYDLYLRLLALMAYATSAALRDGDRERADSFVRTANDINKDNPNWISYEITLGVTGSKEPDFKGRFTEDGNIVWSSERKKK